MEGAKKLLVVDDNLTIMKLLEKRLSGEGYQVLTACNGLEGLNTATREMPDLIISDVDMPVMDGGEMASKLKASIRTRQIPIIFLTALVTRDEEVQQSASEDIYLSKSCKPSELLALIRERLALNPR